MEVPLREGDDENRTRTLELSHIPREDLSWIPSSLIDGFVTTIINIQMLPVDSWVGRWEVGQLDRLHTPEKNFSNTTGSSREWGPSWHTRLTWSYKVSVRCLKPELVKTVKDLYLAWQARLVVKILVIWKNRWKSLGHPRLPVPPCLQCVAQAILASESVKRSRSRINFNSISLRVPLLWLHRQSSYTYYPLFTLSKSWNAQDRSTVGRG